MYSYDIRIPKDRVAVLIGTKGDTKRYLESVSSCSLLIDSKEGDVAVSGEDPLQLFSIREVILAIGRGFNPDIAIQLLKPDYSFEQISFTDYARSRNDLERIRGRVIGREGKARGFIEQFTETWMCVYGKTVSVIGETHRVTIARRAIESLLQGSPHTNVYAWLEKKRRELKRREFEEREYA